jgi:hypothetical protein
LEIGAAAETGSFGFGRLPATSPAGFGCSGNTICVVGFILEGEGGMNVRIIFAMLSWLAFVPATAAAPVVLSCPGTRQLNSEPEQEGSVLIEIDIAKKTLAINGDTFPLTGNASGAVISSSFTDKDGYILTLTLNRITGALSYMYANPKLAPSRYHESFNGVCRPATRKRLF